MGQSYDPRLGSVRTKILVGYVFSVFPAIAAFIALIVLGIGALFLGAFALILIPEILVALIYIVVSIVTFLRLRRMYGAAKRGDIATLKQHNSIGWAIVALLFAGLIPGIMLLLVHGPISEMSLPQPQQPKISQ